MATMLAPLIERAEHDFGLKLNRVLSPAQTIQTPELLRGRGDKLAEIRKAFYSDGRQVFIFGFRGVGKSSLAQTAAFQRQSADAQPVMVQCSDDMTCFDVVHQIARNAFPSDPRTIKKTLQTEAGAELRGLSLKARTELEQGAIPKPEDLEDCARLLAFASKAHSKTPVVVVDELDLVIDPAEQRKFANLVKMIGDRHIPINIIFCGIGESLEDLLTAHMSAHRYIHAVSLRQLDFQARIEIIDNAADAMGIVVDDTTRYRIATISDGFPHYIHLLCEKLFWQVFYADNKGRVTPDLFEQALLDTGEELQPELKVAYEKATRKYTNDNEQILWAVADGDNFERPSREIYQSYVRIMTSLNMQPLDRTKFNNKINRLKKPSCGEILEGTRQGWYAYKDKIVRGYARLRATQLAVKLEREHPLQPKRFDTLISSEHEL